MSTVSGIQGHLLDITVVGCAKLKDTEWISRQDPYVCLEYATTKFRTRTCTDGGKNPVFQEKTVVPLIEGLREISVTVWNSNTLKFDDFIGTGKIQLQKALSQGYDDSSWPLQTKSGRFAGEVKVIMHYPNANQKAQKPASQYPAAPAYAPPPAYGYAPAASAPYPHVCAHGAPPAAHYPAPPQYQQQQASHYPPPQQPYPYPPTGYPPQQQKHPYPPPPQAQPYPYPPQSSGYPGAYPPPPNYY